MQEYKNNWQEYKPPLIPIYFVEYESLKSMLSDDAYAISIRGLHVMLGYFEQYERFEKAALVRDAINYQKDNPKKEPPMSEQPDLMEGDEPWQEDEEGNWYRPLSDDEMDKFGLNDKDKGDDEMDPPLDNWVPFNPN